MKKSGFTLVELLGVIILLGLVSAAIATPILAQLNKSSEKIDKAVLNMLNSNVDLYMTKYSNTYQKTSGNVYYITIDQLIRSGLLEEEFLDSYSEQTLSRNTQIKVTVNSNSYNYEIPTGQLNNIGDIYSNMAISSTYNYAGGTYIKGEYTNNYVLYNGFIWRIMGRNSDGTIRLIMDQNASSLAYSYTGSYEDSDVREWLNDYFISRLHYNQIIAKEKWYYSACSTTETVVNESAFVEDKVGLLSVQEAMLSLNNSKNYLNNNGNNYLLNTSTTNGLGIILQNSKSATTMGANLVAGIVPVINVYDTTIVSSGTGSNSDPYVLAAFKTTSIGKSLYSNDTMVGEYVSYDNKLYRVSNIDSEQTKLIYNGIYSTSSTYASASNSFNTNNGAGMVLNTTILNTFTDKSKLLTKNIFIGDFYLGRSYKNTIFKKQNLVYDVKLSLPVIGELLTSLIYPAYSSQYANYWLLNMSNASSAYKIDPINSVNASAITNTGYLRPTIYISSSNIIASGNGTVSSPYTLQ